MSKGQFSKDILNAVNKKSKKPVSQREINKLASGVKPSTMQNEDQLRKLINQVSKMANVPVAESTVKDIIKAVQKSGLQGGQLESMMKMMMGKGKK